ncbi:hypothetical protein [Agromyces cerinus]|uniref:Uncharacterized protein n=1 Tax=Agromyces cerinus subsp. cerinus TaxID=232089 RepID=A0A1N6FI51_9MICO|nr:hypothetical protein [Agromyces cerinus]SIN94907.1 hypothetical protein SAMN05443544_2059 [Agromyces cerinus subsp. cerinus]
MRRGFMWSGLVIASAMLLSGCASSAESQPTGEPTSESTAAAVPAEDRLPTAEDLPEGWIAQPDVEAEPTDDADDAEASDDSRGVCGGDFSGGVSVEPDASRMFDLEWMAAQLSVSIVQDSDEDWQALVEQIAADAAECDGQVSLADLTDPESGVVVLLADTGGTTPGHVTYSLITDGDDLLVVGTYSTVQLQRAMLDELLTDIRDTAGI